MVFFSRCLTSWAKLLWALSLVATVVVVLALLESIHVHLACTDIVSVLLKALKKAVVELHAWVLLWGSSHLLLLTTIGRCWCCLVLLDLSLSSMASAHAASHHSADTLVGNLRTSSKGHTSGHGAHETASHATAQHTS